MFDAFLYISEFAINRKVKQIKKASFIVFILVLLNPLMGQETAMSVEADSVEILGRILTSDQIQTSDDNRQKRLFIKSLDVEGFGTVRSGGPSILSTLLHRGMASRHVAVLWNDFNIQSVVNGTYDIGLIPSSFDNTRFYPNGTSSVTGNASIAGALALDHRRPSETITLFESSFSSANNLNIGIIQKFKNHRYQHHLSADLIANQNEYDYLHFGIDTTQRFANFSVWNVNYSGSYLVSEHLKLTGGFWLQNADRDIPPTKTTIDTSQNQVDENFRGFLKMDYYHGDESKFTLRTALFDEKIDFRTASILSIADTKVINAAFDYSYGDHLTLSGQWRNDRVDATFFASEFERNTFAFLLDVKRSIKTWKIGITARPEWVGNQSQPIQLGFRLNKEVSDRFSTSLRYNKGYNLPSFNDLYWPTGGNEDLKTEQSHELDAGLLYKANADKGSLIGLNLFYSAIDDWIQWSPINGQFQPTNQKKVRNLGLEFEVKHDVIFRDDSRLSFRLIYGFTDSRIVKQYLTSENEGKRSIFVPAHKVSATIQYTVLGWNLFLNPLYYSKRYDTVDNSTFVPGFFLLDVECTKSVQIKALDFLFSIGVENSLNNDYENIRFYPMPLRVLSIGLKLKV